MLKRTHTCGDLTPEHVGPDGHPQRLGRRLARLRRARLHRPPRPLRRHPGRLRARGRRRAARPPRRELRNEYVDRRQGGRRPRACPARRTPSSRPARSRSGPPSSRSSTPRPRPPSRSSGAEPNEELRLKYRYLDLRRPAMQKVFLLRHRMAQVMRNTMSDLGFLEVETPDPRPEHARRGARLPRAQPRPRRPFLRPAAVAAALQATADGRRASTAISRSPAASATRTSAPTASPSSPSSTSRCRSSRTRTS